jgi:hypothetical protein
MKMTDEQIELLRRAIQQEIEVASIDGSLNTAHGDGQKKMQMRHGKVFRRVLNP